MTAFAFKNEDLPHYTIDEWKMWDGKWELIKGIFSGYNFKISQYSFLITQY